MLKEKGFCVSCKEQREARRSYRRKSCREGSVLTLWAGWAMGMLIHNGTMPSQGHRKDVGRTPVEGCKLRITGELTVHKKAADQKGWEPRKLGIRSNALA